MKTAKLTVLFMASAVFALCQATTGWVRTDAANSWTGVQTFTAPVLNNAVVNGPTTVVCGTSCTAKPGVTVSAGLAGTTYTLPTSSGSGSTYVLNIDATITSAAVKVLLATTTDAIVGTAITWTGSTAKVFAGNASAYHSIQLPYSGTPPSYAMAGDTITCYDIAAGTYVCNMTIEATTTATTPYSASTS